MVISQILGGLGNQMFQYAAGRALSLASNQPLSFDLIGFENYRLHHGFELQRVFNLDVNEADTQIVQDMLGWRSNCLVKKILKRSQFAPFRGHKFVVEPHFHYWPGLISLAGDSYLVGYWQSEQYFKAFENTVRQDFIFRDPLVGRNSDFALEMKDKQSVSLHVRRGDYVSNPKNRKVMNLCEPDYYMRAIAHIAKQVSDPTFYIFSDDPDWVERHLPMKFSNVIVSHNRGKDSYIDMQLMSLCKHHIIANSSFSWWGAWLNSDKNKIVVAPQKWFVNEHQVRDLFPPGWVVL